MEDITERRNSNIILKASLQEKELLLKEIHHRVKNNLQLVYSLLDLQSLNIKDKKVQQMLRNTQARVKSMALIHEELYKTPDLARIRMKSYVENMVHYLFNLYNTRVNPISLECDITDITMTIDMAIPCALIITELVSNSLKYAFSDGSNDKITIVLKRSDKMKYSLMVSDNGKGLPDSVDIDNTPSLGLQIVKTLTRQLKGKLALDKSPGTCYRVDFNTAEV
jgi:two-component sensor histidine kinase